MKKIITRRAAGRVPYLIGALTLALSQTGCFGGSGGGSSSKDSATQTGVFVDSPVAGLSYATDSLQGVTDGQGAFEYRDDETVVFSIGELKLGEAQGADIVDVPVMAGANQGDTPGLIEGLKWYMPWMADDNESEVFAYVFDHLPDNWSSQGSLAYHGAELVYVFDYPGSFMSHYLLGLTGLQDPTGDDTPTPEGFFMNHPGWNANDITVTDNMRAMWTNFARTGAPSIEGQDWPAYTSENDTYLRIGQSLNVETGLDDAFPD